MPTIAIRSSSSRRTGERGSGAGRSWGGGASPASPSSSTRKRASAAMFGWSNTTVLGVVYSPENARFSRFRSSTAINESIPRSKNPTVGAGVDVSLRTACTSRCRKDTSRPSRSATGVCRSRDTKSSARAGEPASALGPADNRSSRKDGRSSTASSNTDQSMDITTEFVTSWRTSLSKALRPCWGVNQRPPSAARCRSIRSFCSAASPISDHAPQAMACPGSPIARRWAASWSRNALAAAWFAWPGLPMTPTRLEKRTKRSRSRPAVARCKCHAPSTFGHSTCSNLSQLWFGNEASDNTPTL